MKKQERRQNAQNLSEHGAFTLLGVIIKSAIDDFSRSHNYIDMLKEYNKRLYKARKTSPRVQKLIADYENAHWFLFVNDQKQGYGLIDAGLVQKEALRLAGIAPNPLIKSDRVCYAKRKENKLRSGLNAKEVAK